MTASKARPVVVTTQHRGVFFGYTTGGSGKTVDLEQARMCVYWPTQVHGVLGLAAGGPLRGSRVTPEVPRLTLQDVTAVMDATPEAEKAWLAQPWS